MKKSLLFLPLALALWSCSDNDLANNPGQNTTGVKETRYIAVNIVDNSLNSRADYTDTDNDYEAGLPKENEVTSIRFYLFDEDGELFGEPQDCTAEPLSSADMDHTVEKTLQAVIVFRAEKKEDGEVETPVKIIAVLNPPTITAPSDTAALIDTKGDYLKTSAGEFIMSNAVYAVSGGGNASTHIAYDVASDNIKESREAALANPVEIFVERVVAKARVGVDEDSLTPVDDQDYTYTPTGTTIEIYGESNGEKTLNVKFLGWNVTGTAKQTYLLKHINPSWGYADNGWLGTNFAWGASNAWNYPTFHRSFWAQNYDDLTEEDLNFGAFTKADELEENADAQLASLYDMDGETEVYMLENAAKNEDGVDPSYPTKIIVAAQLVDDEGNPVELGYYEGTYYLQEDLKQALLNKAKIFKKSGSDTSITYDPATTEDIPLVFVSATEAGMWDDYTSTDENENNVNRYNSFAQVNEDTTKGGIESIGTETFYTKDSSGNYNPIADIAALNEILLGLEGQMKVWTEGYTYYWLDIAHLNTSNTGYGKVGVVRNHIYDYTISAIKGLGIPVTNPSETIYPEDPNDPELMFIAARINILAWRLVSNSNASLGWD